jgi:hypothetical protein
LRPRRQRPEQTIQRAVFQHLAMRGAPNVFAFHVPLGGLRSKAEAAIMVGLGVRAGVPDVLCIHLGRIYGMELKADGGSVTPVQLRTLAAMEAAGATTAIATGLDAALRKLEDWGILRGRVQ